MRNFDVLLQELDMTMNGSEECRRHRRIQEGVSCNHAIFAVPNILLTVSLVKEVGYSEFMCNRYVRFWYPWARANQVVTHS